MTTQQVFAGRTPREPILSRALAPGGCSVCMVCPLHFFWGPRRVSPLPGVSVDTRPGGKFFFFFSLPLFPSPSQTTPPSDPRPPFYSLTRAAAQQPVAPVPYFGPSTQACRSTPPPAASTTSIPRKLLGELLRTPDTGTWHILGSWFLVD